MKRFLRFALALALLTSPAAPSGSALADKPGAPPDPQTLQWLQRQFREGRLARIRSAMGEQVVVSPAFSFEGVRTVDSSGVVTLTNWSQIERIDARAGSSARAAKFGVVIGAGLGVAAGYLAAMGEESDDGWAPFIYSTVFFAGAGATVGALVGAFIPGWQKVYPGKPGGGSAWGLQKK